LCRNPNTAKKSLGNSNKAGWEVSIQIVRKRRRRTSKRKGKDRMTTKGSQVDVYLRLGNSPHGAYQDLVRFPPKGVRYTTDAAAGKLGASRKTSHALKLAAWGVVSKATIPFAVVNAKDAQVVHSTNNFIPITKKPWLVDSEHVWGLFGFRYGRIKSPYFNWQLKSALSAANCKAVLAWSDKASFTIRRTIGPKLARKVRVIRPAIAQRPQIRRKPRDDPAFLFVGKRFYEKGGHDLLAAYEKVRKKADATLTIISDTPAEVERKYSKFKDITFEKPDYSHDELSRRFYQKSNIFVFPTYVDTYGMVTLEAMGHGLPVISTDCLAMPELVINERNGLLSPLSFHIYDNDGLFYEKMFPKWDKVVAAISGRHDEQFINGISQKMLSLAEDGKLWAMLSKNCIKDSATGRLSVGRRNELLLDAYKSAIK
jgi:glycosyltransferase involved in cell wall biosynthesis